MIILEKHPVSGYEPRHYRREPSGSVGVGVDSRRTSADPLSAYRAGVFAGLGVREPGKRPGCAHTLPMTIGKPRGPAPKPDSQRRRAQKPVSYGLAEPVVAGQAAQQPRLGFTAHKLVRDMWKALANSVESQFFSAMRIGSAPAWRCFT